MVSEDICVQLSYVGLAHKDAARLPAAVGSTFEITTGLSATRKLSPHGPLLKHPHDKHLPFPEMNGRRRERGYQGWCHSLSRKQSKKWQLLALAVIYSLPWVLNSPHTTRRHNSIVHGKKCRRTLACAFKAAVERKKKTGKGWGKAK